MTYPEAPSPQLGGTTEGQETVIIFYRGCTRTRAQQYLKSRSPRERVETMITPFNGQFHLQATTEAVYFSRAKDVAKAYAANAAEWVNSDRPQKEPTIKERVDRGCSCGNEDQEHICTCLLMPETGVLLRFEIPESWFLNLRHLVWNEACGRWVEWVHRNRTNDPHPEKFSDYDGAHVVEGPLAESIGFHHPGDHPPLEEPRPVVGADGQVVTQTCFKGPELMEMLGDLIGFLEEI